MFNSRLGCSSISFRHQDLSTALRTIADLGFEEIDLGALPGVCDHVPYELDLAAVAACGGRGRGLRTAGALGQRGHRGPERRTRRRRAGGPRTGT